jgi:DNA-directed RNA polymerase specialized sigma54-like protein
VWIIISMGIFATTVVAIIHQTTISDIMNNIYVGTDRTVLNNKLFIVSAVASAAGSAIGGFLSPDVTTMGTIFTVEAIVSTCITIKVVKLMLNYLKENSK